MNDPLLAMVARLPQAEPDARRAARVRTRCHAALARREARRAPKPPATATRIWEPALAGLCLVYLGEVIRQALRLYSMR
jgi:hypothetical protein